METIKLEELSSHTLTLIEFEFEQQLKLWLSVIDIEVSVNFEASFEKTKQVGLEMQALFSQLPENVQKESADLQKAIHSLIVFAKKANKLNDSLLENDVSGEDIEELFEESENCYVTTRNHYETYKKKRAFAEKHPLLSKLKSAVLKV